MKLTPPVKDIFYEPGTGSGFMVQLNTNTTELNAMDPCWKNICDKKMFLIAKVLPLFHYILNSNYSKW